MRTVPLSWWRKRMLNRVGKAVIPLVSVLLVGSSGPSTSASSRPPTIAVVKDINPGPGDAWFYDSGSPRTIVSMGTDVYFSARDGVHGYELWKSDGTADGTQLIGDIRAGHLSAFPSYLTV